MGYKSDQLTLAKICGFAVPIFPLLIFIKKIADTTYSGPLFFHVLRYLDIYQINWVFIGVKLITKNLAFQKWCFLALCPQPTYPIEINTEYEEGRGNQQ